MEIFPALSFSLLACVISWLFSFSVLSYEGYSLFAIFFNWVNFIISLGAWYIFHINAQSVNLGWHVVTTLGRSGCFLPYLLSISISMSQQKNLPCPNKNDHSASYLSRYLSSTFITFVLFPLFISLLNYSILLLLRTCRHNNSF